MAIVGGNAGKFSFHGLVCQIAPAGGTRIGAFYTPLLGPVLFLGVAVAVFFFAKAILASIPTASTKNADSADAVTMVIFLTFGFSGVLLIAAWLFVRYRVSDLGIESRNLLGKIKLLPWFEVQRVRFSALARTFILRGSTSSKMGVSAAYLGLPEFAHKVLLHVSLEAMYPATHAVLRETELGHLPGV